MKKQAQETTAEEVEAIAQNQDYGAANRVVLAKRWSWVLDWIAAADEPEDAALLSDLPAEAIRINGVQLSGGFDPEGEANLQASLIPLDAPEATIYGLGEGWLARALLKRPQLKTLRVVPLSGTVAQLVFNHLPASDWLSDPRVELIDPCTESELRTPFSLSPAELILADSDGSRLRDLVLLELSTPFLHRRRAAQGVEIQERIAGNRAHLEADGDVRELDGAWTKARVHVIAAGPSLAESMVLLKERDPTEPIVACDGALRSLVAEGITPDVVLSMDMDREALLGLLDVPEEVMQKVTLIYDPVAHCDAVDGWTGVRLATYGSNEAYDDIKLEVPKGGLWNAGSVLHAAVDLAKRAGAAEVVLHGADFATPEGKSHVDGFAWQKNLPDRGPNGSWVEAEDGTRLRTLPNLVGYLRDMERYISNNPELQFTNASSGARIAGAEKLEVSQ
ncbi:MAG: hypothetical protein ACI8PQ_002721 [Planctomycetota bacterium]|jgi:hypothetical protein